MGSNDVPPPHVPNHVVPVCNLLLAIGGSLWTVCYGLFIRESFRSHSYVYGLYVAETSLEQYVFITWLLMDCALVYGMCKNAKHEWSHSPVIARNISVIFLAMALVATIGHWTFAKWWIDNEIGRREGKLYKGVVGPDTTELGFWSAVFCQLYLSAASLWQLIVRQHSPGVSWSIWATRALGSIIGLDLVYAWEWYFWPEAHIYFMSPFAIFLWATSLTCDVVYGFALWRIEGAVKTKTP